MKKLNDFLNEMMKVAKGISKIECPDEATTYFKSQYNILENKSDLIGNDLDSLFELSSKNRVLTKNKINIEIEKINDVFRTNENKYYKSGYYDSALQEELSKFNKLFFLTYRFMQNLGSTQSKNYSYDFLKKEHQKDSNDSLIQTITEEYNKSFTVSEEFYSVIEDNNISNDSKLPRKEIHLRNLDIKGLGKHLSPHFINCKELYSVLNGNIPKEKLIFTGNSTELLYVFNKLKLNNRIVEERQEIIDWILKHFQFKNKKTCKITVPVRMSFYNKYREDVEKIPKKYSYIQKIEPFYKEK